MIDDEERQKIMGKLATRWQEQDAEEWNRSGPSSMLNGLGALNIYLRLLGITFPLFFGMGFTIVVIWKIMIPEGHITWGPSLMAVAGVSIASISAWFVLLTVKDIRGGQTSLVGFVDEKSIVTQSSGQMGGSTIRRISVEGESFNVSKAMYNWVSQGDEICVTYWPRTKTISKVSKTGRHEEFPYEHLTREEAVVRWKKRMEEAEEKKKQGY